MPPALPGTVKPKKPKIPSSQKDQQEEQLKDEVAPTELPQRGREMGHKHVEDLGWGGGLEAMKTHPQSGIAPLS